MKSQYLTVKQIAERGPFSDSSLRQLIFAERQNGLFEAGAIYRVGRKVLVHEGKLDAWIEAQQAPRPTKLRTVAAVLSRADAG